MMNQIQQIFWLDTDTLRSEAVKQWLKRKNIEVFTLNKYEELDYFLQDLKPNIIIIHHEFFEQASDEIKDSLSSISFPCHLVELDYQSDFTYSKKSSWGTPIKINDLLTNFQKLF